MAVVKKVAVLGTAVLGSQIAFQTAFHGFTVIAYDIDAEAIAQAKARFTLLAHRMGLSNVPVPSRLRP